MTKPKLVKDKAFYMLLLTIAIPIAMQNLIVFFTQMLDTLMLGELGDITVSAASLANQPFFILTMLCFGLSGGASVLAAQYFGKNDLEPIRRILTMSILLALSAGFLVGLAAIFFPTHILSLYTPNPMVIQEGAKYLRIMGFAYIFFASSNVFFGIIRSVHAVKVAVASNIIALITNGTLNYILIFGKFGFPQLGIEGAAIATLITRIIEFAIAVVYMFYFDKRLQVKFKKFFKIDITLFKDMIKISTPVILNEVMWGLGITMQARLLGQLGTEAVAANSIVGIIQQLATVGVFGVANAAAVIIGKAIGEGDYQKARDRGFTFVMISIAMGILVSGIMLSVKDVTIGFFNVSLATKELASQLIIVASIVGFFVSIAATSVVGILRGGGDTKFSLWIEMFTLWGIAVPAAYFAAFVLKWDVVAVFMVMKMDEAAKCVLCIIRMKGTKWIKDVTR